jgi:hypothetical protein
MKNLIRNGALALSLLAGGALIAAPMAAEAKSIQRDGYFGGTYEPIGPRNNRYVKRHHRNYGHYDRRYYDRGYYGPRYSQYGPRYRYGYRAPYYYDRSPGFSITIR